LVDEALNAVGSITKSSLDEIKNLRLPPEPIHDVLNAVLRLFGNQDTSWKSMKKFLSNKGVIDQVSFFHLGSQFQS
jgi:dynein heavy chain 2